MNAVPGFERPEDKPKTPWLTMAVAGLLTTAMAAGLILRFVQSIEWPEDWRLGRRAAAGSRIEDYTLFKIVKIDRGEVHTGYTFARSGDPAPFRQYCYAQINRDGSRIISHVTLAEKRPGNPVRYQTISGEDAAALGLPLEEAEQLARLYCRFRDEGGW